MVLKLHTSREAYKEFYGRNTVQMPKLIAEGRVPMNVSQLMQRRLETRNGLKYIKTAWMDNYFDTGDAIAYHPDGRFKIVLDSQTLREMTPDTQWAGGELLLKEDAYNTLEGEEFKKGKLKKVYGWLSNKEVKAHPVWRALSRDQALLNDYADYIFVEGKQRFGYDTAMGVYPSPPSGDYPEMRLWSVSRLKDRSDTNGRYNLDSNSGRFVGLVSEALGASGKGASNIKAYTMADLQAVDTAIKGLEGTVHSDVLKPFKDLRKKL